MSTRVLVIDDQVKQKVNVVVAYAQEHLYHPGQTQPPGDMPEHTVMLSDGYRCVFSYTLLQGVLYRHLSVSVAARGKLPHPVAVFEIADLFGFTEYQHDGKPVSDWIPALEAERCVVLAQPIEDPHFYALVGVVN